MGWLDDWLTDLGGTPAKALPSPVTPRQPKAAIHEVWFQTCAPRDGDAGGVEVGCYSVADGVLKMHDDKGVPTGKEYRLGPGEDARQIAVRIAREAWRKGRGESDFNRPIGYARFGNA